MRHEELYNAFYHLVSTEEVLNEIFISDDLEKEKLDEAKDLLQLVKEDVSNWLTKDFEKWKKQNQRTTDVNRRLTEYLIQDDIQNGKEPDQWLIQKKKSWKNMTEEEKEKFLNVIINL